jgi:hypothetical protein
MRLAFLAAVAALTACSGDPVKEAQREYDFIREQGGSQSELCDAARKLRSAAVAASDQRSFESAKLSETMHCRNRIAY